MYLYIFHDIKCVSNPFTSLLRLHSYISEGKGRSWNPIDRHSPMMLLRRPFFSSYKGSSFASSSLCAVDDRRDGGGAVAEEDDDRWSTMLPELMEEIIKRVESSEERWPLRRSVVACACVCRHWREVTTGVVRPPLESGTITFPSSLKEV